MNIERITYQRTFNLGNYESLKIGADVLINPGEDAKQALNEAKEFVEQWHKENSNVSNYADHTPEIPIIPKEMREKGNTLGRQLSSDIGKIAESAPPIDEQIKSCTSKAVLKAVYEKIVKGKPELEEIYQAKLKELSHE